MLAVIAPINIPKTSIAISCCVILHHCASARNMLTLVPFIFSESVGWANTLCLAILKQIHLVNSITF